MASTCVSGCCGCADAVQATRAIRTVVDQRITEGARVVGQTNASDAGRVERGRLEAQAIVAARIRGAVVDHDLAVGAVEAWQTCAHIASIAR